MSNKFVNTDLYLFDDGNDLRINAEKLFDQQTSNWNLASTGYSSLNKIQKRKFIFNNFTIDAHFNPGRIVSSSAKVDSKSISDRPCFLCAKNLPPDQKGVKIFGDYFLLVNPFPIFDKHFTIPVTDHKPQLIKSEISNFLEICYKLGNDYSVFYNGPKCGASAPDHLHFQAGNYGFMNIDCEYESIKDHYGKLIHNSKDVKLWSISDSLRNIFSIESDTKQKVIEEFEILYNALEKDENEDEPMMNLICTYNKKWRLLVFPRSQHRPSYFFEEGENKILISPAAVDLGGVLIFPREEDFKKINEELIVDIYKQVTPNNKSFGALTEKLIVEFAR